MDTCVTLKDTHRQPRVKETGKTHSEVNSSFSRIGEKALSRLTQHAPLTSVDTETDTNNHKLKTTGAQ